MSWLNSQWYAKKPSFFWKCLIPAEFLYRGIIFLRRACYRYGVFKSERLPVPIIIVGNLTLGGVGKTPLTAAIVEFFQKNNLRPGIVSRGYKGKASSWPQIVEEKSDPRLFGDEPVLLAQKTACPIVVGPNRVEAAKKLLEKWDLDVLIADDGLQHYALERDIEIVVVDAKRALGNGRCLPYGPLREPSPRLKTVDFIVKSETAVNAIPESKLLCHPPQYSMNFEMGDLFRLNNPVEKKTLSDCGQKAIHAFAGIGHPKRFFEMLRNKGLTIIEHPFPDHHQFRLKDFLGLRDSDMIIMTEKDAVKCHSLNDARIWVLPIEARLAPEFFFALLEKLP